MENSRGRTSGTRRERPGTSKHSPDRLRSAQVVDGRISRPGKVDNIRGLGPVGRADTKYLGRLERIEGSVKLVDARVVGRRFGGLHEVVEKVVQAGMRIKDRLNSDRAPRGA